MLGRGWFGLAMTFALALAPALAGCGGGKAHFIDAGPTDASTVDCACDDIDAGVDAAFGHPGTGMVTGAVRAVSPGYRLYGTLRSGDGSSASPGYQRRGGVTGATQP